ncbi:MAG: hypothetical protein ABIZ80_18025, partial [Bryobacteraceae bacterium]
AWLNHPRTKQLGELERRATVAEAQQKLVEFAGGITKNPPSQERLQLIHRLNDATKLSDTEVTCTIAIVRSVARAINPLLPQAKRYGADELRDALAAVQGRYAPIMNNARIVRYLFTYQTADDSELERHVQFWESGSGRWLIAAVQSGYASAALRISSALTAKIPERVKALR